MNEQMGLREALLALVDGKMIRHTDWPEYHYVYMTRRKDGGFGYDLWDQDGGAVLRLVGDYQGSWEITTKNERGLKIRELKRQRRELAKEIKDLERGDE